MNKCSISKSFRFFVVLCTTMFFFQSLMAHYAFGLFVYVLKNKGHHSYWDLNDQGMPLISRNMDSTSPHDAPTKNNKLPVYHTVAWYILFMFVQAKLLMNQFVLVYACQPTCTSCSHQFTVLRVTALWNYHLVYCVCLQSGLVSMCVGSGDIS